MRKWVFRITSLSKTLVVLSMQLALHPRPALMSIFALNVLCCCLLLLIENAMPCILLMFQIFLIGFRSLLIQISSFWLIEISGRLLHEPNMSCNLYFLTNVSHHFLRGGGGKSALQLEFYYIFVLAFDFQLSYIWVQSVKGWFVCLYILSSITWSVLFFTCRF